MMHTALIILITILSVFVVGSLSGHIVHWLLHTNLFKRFAKSHDSHHDLYPPDDFVSDKYRSAGKDTSTFIFTPIVTISVLLLSSVLWLLFSVWWIFPTILVEGIAVGILNDRMHDAFHLKNHWMNKYRWFKRLKYLHRLHHKYPEKNMGIIWFLPDRIFGTFRSTS